MRTLVPTSIRFATGVAIGSCARQLGVVIGIAALIAFVAADAANPLDAVRRCWSLIAGTAGLAAVLSVLVGRARAREVEDVTPSAPLPGSARRP